MTQAKESDALMAALEKCLVDRDEARFKIIAFVNRHTVLAALSRPTQPASGAEVREALEPFAREADTWWDQLPDDARPWIAEPGNSGGDDAQFTVGDLRRLRTIYEALPIPEAGAGECDGSCGMLDCHSHDDEHPYEADGYLTIDHGPPEKPAPQPQQAVEAVEAMRRACIAAVRAEQRYEGSDFPVCNAIVREIEAIPALPAPKVEGQG